MAFRMVAKQLASFSTGRLHPAQRAAFSACTRLLFEARPALAPALQHAARQAQIPTAPLRSFAVSAVQNADAQLVEALDAEIKFEAENNNTTADDVEPPGDWILTEKPGDCTITLTRQHQGEKILVEFSISEQAPGDLAPMPEVEEVGDESVQDPEVDLAVNFEASVIKSDTALTFDLTSDGSYIEINHVSLANADAQISDETYDGPVYSELDERVQQRFQDYLEERGINAALGEYLLVAADSKELREYSKWLGNVKSFVQR